MRVDTNGRLKTALLLFPKLRSAVRLSTLVRSATGGCEVEHRSGAWACVMRFIHRAAIVRHGVDCRAFCSNSCSNPAAGTGTACKESRARRPPASSAGTRCRCLAGLVTDSPLPHRQAPSAPIERDGMRHRRLTGQPDGVLPLVRSSVSRRKAAPA